MIQLKAPWNERNGRFSPLKAVVFAGLFVPAAWIAYLAATGALEPKVVTEMIHRTGLWAIRFLTLSLLVTPLMRGARYTKLVSIRRMVGVAAFAYATAHLCLYIVDQHFALLHVASEIALRFYLTIGFVDLARPRGARGDVDRCDDPASRTALEEASFDRLRARRARAPPLHDPGEGRHLGARDDDRLLHHPDAVPGAHEAWAPGLARGDRRSDRLGAPRGADRGLVVCARAPHPLLGGFGREHRSGHGFRPSAYVALGGAAFLVVTVLRRAPAARRSAVLPAQPAASAGR